MQTWAVICGGAVAVSVACWAWSLWRDHQDRFKVCLPVPSAEPAPGREKGGKGVVPTSNDPAGGKATIIRLQAR